MLTIVTRLLRVTMATPPVRTQSLLSQALGKRPAAAPAGARPSASGGPMVGGVRQKQQKASGAGLLGEAQTLSRPTSRPAFKGGYTPRNSLGAAHTSPTPPPAIDPDGSAIPCGDARRGGRWRDNCQLACCSTAAAIRRNGHGSPANSDDTEEDEEDDHGAAGALAEAQQGQRPHAFTDLISSMSGGPRPSSGGAIAATSGAATGAAMAAMTAAAGAAAGARVTGTGAVSAAAGAAAARAAPAPSAAAAASAAGAHRFVWAEDLTRALEAQAVPLGQRSREDLARLASENYQVSTIKVVVRKFLERPMPPNCPTACAK